MCTTHECISVIGYLLYMVKFLFKLHIKMQLLTVYFTDAIESRLMSHTPNKPHVPHIVHCCILFHVTHHTVLQH